MSSAHGARLLGSALAGLLALALLGQGVATAQEDGEESADTRQDHVELRVADFTGAVSPEGTFRLRVRVANRSRLPAEQLRVLASFHRKAFHRADFARAMDEGAVGELWSSISSDVPTVAGRQVATVEVRRTAEELGFGGARDVEGVYPLVIRLQRDGRTVDTVRTAVVVISSQVSQPLRATLVAPLEAPPILRAGGVVAPDGLLDDLAPRGRLGRLLTGLGGRPDVPITFAVDGRLLDDAADLADGYAIRRGGQTVEVPADSALARAAGGFLTQFRRLATQRQVETVILPYGPADLNALAHGDMAQEAARLVDEGRQVVERHGGVRPTPGTLLLTGGLSAATLRAVTSAGVRTLVLPGGFLRGGDPSRSASPPAVRRLRTDGPDITAAVPDPWLSDLLADAEGRLARLDPVVAVQRVVAETAAVYFERPFADEPRGLLLTAPLGWDPPDEVAAGLPRAFHAAPWLQPVSLTTLLEQVEPQQGTARLAYPDEARDEELPRRYVNELRAARRALGSLAGVLAEDHETPSRFDRLLLTAGSLWFRDELADGLPLIREVRRAVEELYQAVRVVRSPTVLLSGIEGQIPVTIENAAPIPLRLLVRMETQRFAFEGGPARAITVPPASTQTVGFRTRARTPGGTYPIRVVVEDVGGALQLAEGSVVVRSTGVSATALAVVVGAGLFLLGWWARTLARRRRAAAHPAGETSEAA